MSQTHEHDNKSANGGAHRMLAASDELTDELREQLPKLIDSVLNEPDFAPEFKVVKRLKDSAPRKHILDNADRLLAETNAAIAVLRATRAMLKQHEATTALDPEKTHESLPTGAAVLVIGVSLPVLMPVLIWGTWSYISSAFGGFFGFLISSGALILGVVSCATIFSFVKRANDPTKTFGPLGALVALALTGTVGAGLLVWRLWLPTYRAVGPFAWPIWIVALVLVMILMGVLLNRIGDQLARSDISETGLLLLRRSNGLLVFAGVYGIAAGITVASFTTISASQAASFAVITAFLIPVIRATLIPVLLTVYTRLRSALAGDSEETGWGSESKQLSDAFEKATEEWQRAMRVSIRDHLKTWLNQVAKPSFSVTLNLVSSAGLLQMHSQESIVATKGVFGRFEDAIAQVGGGTIGVAGPQGVGKSTLLEAYRDGRFIGAGREHLVVFESVPVRYDPRDFALHLYAALCKAVMEFAEQHPSSQASTWMRRLRGLLRYIPRPTVFLGWLAIAYLVLVLIRNQSLSHQNWGSLVAWFIVAMLAGVIVLLTSTRGSRSLRHDKLTLATVTDLAMLSVAASGKLEGIQFQQRHTSGWSGNVSTAVGLSGSRSISLERTRQAMSYPELVRDFRDFLTATVHVIARLDTAAVTPVAIIIDELDKVQVLDQAQEFVNEVKALFGLDVPGCIFLISVSEEALTSFERRGTPLRAAFDSTFDIIFRIDNLKLEDTRALLYNRIVGIGEPFIALCHSFSAGLPREIVRKARDIVGCGKTSLTDVARAVVTRDMDAKEAALRTLIGRQTEAEPYASNLIRHLAGYDRADADLLLASLRNPPIKKSDVQAASRELQEVFQLELEALCYRYYCATILAVFNDLMTQASLDLGQAEDGPSSFNRLAEARGLLSVNVRVAWFMITSFRRAWHLEVVEPPW